ncbi:MAG: hypothetical protein K2G30_02275, partial [Muribaculaceae bacterium]|nr:hypothetical protein [Muribaculaceae bacterium]
MKKQLLLGSALLAFAFASAQTVQNIPTAPGEYLKISETDVKFDTDMPNDEAGNPIEHFSTHEKMSWLDADNKKTTDGTIVYVNNTHDNESASWIVKSAEESCYIIRFQYSSKNDAPGAWATFKLLDRTTENSLWEKRYEAAAVQTASYSFAPSEVYVDTPIPAGEYIFKVEFQQEDPTKPSFRMCMVEFEAREEITEVNLMTYCEPAEGGSITINPSRNKFIAGTDVTAQAIANTGYKFIGWDNGFDDVFNTNPYAFTIEEDMDLTAMFEEVLMYSPVPGYVNFENTRLVGQGKVQYDTHQIKFYNPDTDAYDILHEGAPGTVPWLGDYRNNNSEAFEIDVTEAGEYNFVYHWSLKTKDTETPTLTFELFDSAYGDIDPTTDMPVWTSTLAPEAATNQWFQFKEQKEEGINLTKGRKTLFLYFKEPVLNKYTINILDMKFGIGDNYGDNEAAIE